MKLSEFLRANPSIDAEISPMREGDMATELVALMRVVQFDDDGDVMDSLKMVASKTCGMVVQTGLLEAGRQVINAGWSDGDQVD